MPSRLRPGRFHALVGMMRSVDTSGAAAEPTALSRYDYMLYSIGAVAQTHVAMELTLRGLWGSLAALGYGGDTQQPPRGLANLVRRCGTSIRRLPVPATVKEAAAGVLELVVEATRLRNRVVHDYWIDVEPGELSSGWAGWVRTNPELPLDSIRSEASDQLYVERCRLQVGHCLVLISDLTQLLWHYVPVVQGGHPVDTVDELLDRLQRRL